MSGRGGIVPPLSFVRSWRSKIRYMSCIQKFNAFLSLPLSGWLRIVAVVAGFIWLFLRYCHFVQYEWDYAVYYLASQAIWSGKNAYDPQVLLELEKQVLFLGYGGLPFCTHRSLHVCFILWQWCRSSCLLSCGWSSNVWFWKALYGHVFIC